MPAQRNPASKPDNQFLKTLKHASFWIAAVIAFLLSPQLLDIADWLAQSVFAQHVSYDVVIYFKIALFLMLSMVVLSVGAAGITSATTTFFIMVISRMPIFKEKAGRE